MAAKTKWAAFKASAKVPADVIGAAKDKPVPAHTPVKLPAEYVDHLVAEGFAVEVDAPKPGKAGGKSDDGKAKADAEAKAAAKVKADAEQAVADAQAALDATEEGAPEREAATVALDDAKAALAALDAPAS